MGHPVGIFSIGHHEVDGIKGFGPFPGALAVAAGHGHPGHPLAGRKQGKIFDDRSGRSRSTTPRRHSRGPASASKAAAWTGSWALTVPTERAKPLWEAMADARMALSEASRIFGSAMACAGLPYENCSQTIKGPVVDQRKKWKPARRF
jgi:hypothetical protein